MQRSVVVRLDVSGTPMATSLATVMEGARQGGDVFQALCAQVLGPGWTAYQDGDAVPGELVAQQADAEHFVDWDPDMFRIVLNYLRDGGVLPAMDAHLLQNVKAKARAAGMAQLANSSHPTVSRVEAAFHDGEKPSRRQVMQMLNGPHRNFSGMDLSGLDLSNLDFNGASLFRVCLDHANLSGANFSGCNIEGVSLNHANATGACFGKVLLQHTQADSSSALVVPDVLHVTISLDGGGRSYPRGYVNPGDLSSLSIYLDDLEIPESAVMGGAFLRVQGGRWAPKSRGEHKWKWAGSRFIHISHKSA
jgi:hypothetical protein